MSANQFPLPGNSPRSKGEKGPSFCESLWMVFGDIWKDSMIVGRKQVLEWKGKKPERQKCFDRQNCVQATCSHEWYHPKDLASCFLGEASSPSSLIFRWPWTSYENVKCIPVHHVSFYAHTPGRETHQLHGSWLTLLDGSSLWTEGSWGSTEVPNAWPRTETLKQEWIVNREKRIPSHLWPTSEFYTCPVPHLKLPFLWEAKIF